MMMNFDAGTIVQGVMIGVLVAVAKAMWQTTITLAKLGASFDAHVKTDDLFQEETRDRLNRAHP